MLGRDGSSTFGVAKVSLISIFTEVLDRLQSDLNKLNLKENKKTKTATKKKHYNSFCNMLLYSIYSKIESRGFESESV